MKIERYGIDGEENGEYTIQILSFLHCYTFKYIHIFACIYAHKYMNEYIYIYIYDDMVVTLMSL